MVGIISCTSLYPVMSAVMPSSISTASLSIFSCCGRTGGSMVSSSVSLYATMQHGLYLVRRYLSDTTSGQLLACRDNVRSGKSIFSGIVQQQNKRPVVLLEMDVIQPSQFFRCSLPNHRVGQCPRFTGKCTQIVLQLDAPVSTAITALMRGHFLLPVQDDDFFTINLDMYFSPTRESGTE